MLLRLRSNSLPFWVDVDLRDYNGRWVAVAELAGDKELGLGAGPRDAIVAALVSLGLTATGELLVGDPKLAKDSWLG